MNTNDMPAAPQNDKRKEGVGQTTGPTPDTPAHMCLNPVICQDAPARPGFLQQLGKCATTTGCKHIYKSYQKGIIKEQFDIIHELPKKMPAQK